MFNARRMQVLLIAVAVVLGRGPTLAEDTFRYPEASHGKGELQYHGEVPVLIVRGSRAEMGRQIGTLALKPAAKVLELIEGFADRQIPKNVRPFVDVAAKSMYDRFPDEYRQELESMAKAAKVDIRTVIIANTIIDLKEMIGCSSLIVGGERSATGEPLYGRNLDLPYVKGLAEFSLLIVYVPDDANAFAMPNLPGFLMLPSGINEKGLALGTQSVGKPADGSPRFEPTGLASAVAARRVLESCDDVPSARKWLEENRLSRGVSIAACDPKNHGVIEVTTRRALFRGGGDGFCCATNHFRCPELAANTDCWRYARLENTFEKKRVSVKDVAASMKDNESGQEYRAYDDL